MNARAGLDNDTAMKQKTAAQIRQEFIDYFVKKCGHTFVPSSPCVPHDDPTLMFTNAGMNQFKDVLGTGTRPFARGQHSEMHPCRRKHNDLDEGTYLPPYVLRDAGQLVLRRLLQEGGNCLGVDLPTNVWGAWIRSGCMRRISRATPPRVWS